MPGYVFGAGYGELQSNCAIYIQATEVGGTHPALVEAMGRGACIIAKRCPRASRGPRRCRLLLRSQFERVAGGGDPRARRLARPADTLGRAGDGPSPGSVLAGITSPTSTSSCSGECFGGARDPTCGDPMGRTLTVRPASRHPDWREVPWPWWSPSRSSPPAPGRVPRLRQGSLRHRQRRRSRPERPWHGPPRTAPKELTAAHGHGQLAALSTTQSDNGYGVPRARVPFALGPAQRPAPQSFSRRAS